MIQKITRTIDQLRTKLLHETEAELSQAVSENKCPISEYNNLILAMRIMEQRKVAVEESRGQRVLVALAVPERPLVQEHR